MVAGWELTSSSSESSQIPESMSLILAADLRGANTANSGPVESGAKELLGAHLGLFDPTRVSRIVLEVATLSLPTSRLKVRRSMLSNFEKPALTPWLAAVDRRPNTCDQTSMRCLTKRRHRHLNRFVQDQRQLAKELAGPKVHRVRVIAPLHRALLNDVQVVHALPLCEGGLAVFEVPLFECVRHQAALVSVQVLQERHRLDEIVVPLSPARNTVGVSVKEGLGLHASLMACASLLNRFAMQHAPE